MINAPDYIQQMNLRYRQHRDERGEIDILIPSSISDTEKKKRAPAIHNPHREKQYFPAIYQHSKLSVYEDDSIVAQTENYYKLRGKNVTTSVITI